MLSSRYGHVECVQFLLRHGADIDVLNRVSLDWSFLSDHRDFEFRESLSLKWCTPSCKEKGFLRGHSGFAAHPPVQVLRSVNMFFGLLFCRSHRQSWG